MVVELNSNNFFDYVGKDKYVVVKFYTKWCKFCRLMAPEFEKLHDIYQEKRDDLVIARLEGNQNEDIIMKYNIFSFPMLILFRPAEKNIGSLFQGQRKADVMSGWLEENCPKIEKKKEEIIDENKINIDVVKNNQNDVTDEMEFIKREILSLRKKFEQLEGNIEAFSKNSTFSSNKFTPPSFTQLFIFLGVLAIFVAAVITIKRLMKRKAPIFSQEHAKV